MLPSGLLHARCFNGDKAERKDEQKHLCRAEKQKSVTGAPATLTTFIF
ncbi:hypothetical protein F385_1539 [Pantoea agglomerans 299R]|jgi:hypothetical protein|nr:hypothetical protein F385_1539 [Pantoea agglomerans 299R]